VPQKLAKRTTKGGKILRQGAPRGSERDAPIGGTATSRSIGGVNASASQWDFAIFSLWRRNWRTALFHCAHHARRTLLSILLEKTMRSQSGSVGDGAQWRRSNPISDPAKKTGGATGLDGPSASSIAQPTGWSAALKPPSRFPFLSPRRRMCLMASFPRGEGMELHYERCVSCVLI